MYEVYGDSVCGQCGVHESGQSDEEITKLDNYAGCVLSSLAPDHRGV